MTKKKSKRELLRIHLKLNPREVEIRKINAVNHRAARYSVNAQSLTYEEWIDLLKLHDFSCVKCHQQEPRVVLIMDHIIPLSKSGTGSIDNIQPMCGPCNTSKGSKTTNYRKDKPQ